jgi:hypothetical protein
MAGVQTPLALPQDSSPERVVVLVHGTILPGSGPPTWIEPASHFCDRLSRQLPGVTIDSVFRWSGHNNHKARLCAGSQLEKHLREAYTSRAEIVIIAHSHGGNVAAYALANMADARNVIELVCMNTPFFDCRKRRAKLFVQATGFSIFAGGWAAEIVFSSIISHVATVVSWLICALALSDRATSYVEAMQERERTELQPRAPRCRLLSVGYPGDEVSDWLTIIRGLSNAPFWSWRITTKIILVFFVTAAAGFSALFIWFLAAALLRKKLAGNAISDALGFGAVFPLIAIVAFVALSLFLILSFLVPKLVRGNALGFGDTILQNVLLDIRVDRDPACLGPGDFETWTYDDVPVGKRHFAYRQEVAIDYIAGKLRERFRASS